MKRALTFVVGLAAVSFAALGCNGLLGIGAATLAVDDGGTAEAAAPRGLTCDYYCATVTQNCAGANAEFVGSESPAAVCQSMCAALDTGNTIGPTDDDTLGCRIYYAEQAATDAGSCPFAGILGGGKCGTDACNIFCSLDTSYCNVAPVSTTQYATANDCLSVCGNPDGGFPYQTDGGPDLSESGNTLNCRTWHLQNAFGSTTAGKFHCPHTADPSTVCN